jgi:hypothetical protein
MPEIDDNTTSIDWALLVALAEGGESPPEPDYEFTGRSFYQGEPFYSRLSEIDDD